MNDDIVEITKKELKSILKQAYHSGGTDYSNGVYNFDGFYQEGEWLTDKNQEQEE